MDTEKENVQKNGAASAFSRCATTDTPSTKGSTALLEELVTTLRLPGTSENPDSSNNLNRSLKESKTKEDTNQWRKPGLVVDTKLDNNTTKPNFTQYANKLSRHQSKKEVEPVTPHNKKVGSKGEPGRSRRKIVSQKGEKRRGSEIKFRGAWRKEEDEQLIAIVKLRGPCGWTAIAAELDTGRNGRQCRERWSNQINPDLIKSNWSEEEDKRILELHAEFGNRWATIAKYLPGRTDNMVKNRFNGSLLPRTSKKKEKTSSAKRSRQQLEPAQDELMAQTPKATRKKGIRASTSSTSTGTRKSRRIECQSSNEIGSNDGLLESVRAAEKCSFDFSPPVMSMKNRKRLNRSQKRSDSVCSTTSLSNALRRDPQSPFFPLKFSPAQLAETVAMLETPRGVDESLFSSRSPETQGHEEGSTLDLLHSKELREAVDAEPTPLLLATPTHCSAPGSFSLKTPTASSGGRVSTRLNFEPLRAMDDPQTILNTPGTTSSRQAMSPTFNYLVRHYQEILESQKKRGTPERDDENSQKQDKDMHLASNEELQSLLRGASPLPGGDHGIVHTERKQHQQHQSIMSSSLLLQKLLTPRGRLASITPSILSSDETLQEENLMDDVSTAGPTPKNSTRQKRASKRISPSTSVSSRATIDTSSPERWEFSTTPCKCKRSKCLKLYCTCFSSELHCGPDCQCLDCCNSAESELWKKTIQMPNRTSPNKSGESSCKCRNSMCLKKYCDCFRAGVRCGGKCECTDCKNVEGHPSTPKATPKRAIVNTKKSLRIISRSLRS